jgi:hypothetical protein
VYEWILPSLREVLGQSQSNMAECSSAKAEQQWRISLAATEHLLLNTLATTTPDTTQGLVLTAPAPLFSQPQLTKSLQTVTFSAKPFNPLALMPFHFSQTIGKSAGKEAMSVLGDCTRIIDYDHAKDEITPEESILPLLPADPLGAEQFCLVFTEAVKKNFYFLLNQRWCSKLGKHWEPG